MLLFESYFYVWVILGSRTALKLKRLISYNKIYFMAIQEPKMALF